jgi:hypothetical protein
MSGDHMVTKRLTKRVVEALAPKSDRYVVWDSELKGFGVRVTPQGRKTYLVRYRTTGGADRRLTLTTHGVMTTEEAREQARLALADAAMGGDPQGAKAERRAEMTMKELCELYMAEGTATKKETTLRIDRIRIDRHINPRLGNRKVTDITRGDIQRLMIDVGNGHIRGEATPHTRGGKGAAARTVGLLGGIFTFAQERGFVEINPVRGLKRYKDNRRERFLSAAELGKLGDLLSAQEKDGSDPRHVAIKALDRIADHVFSVLRGDNALFFGGSRRNVEALSDRLLRRSERAGVPNEFFPHHGSLSKELREELETRLKAGTLPTTAIATTTLELGIDLGSVKSVAQLGAPRSLASLRQRLGRSGRRKDTPAILRIYTRERHLGRVSDPIDRLRPQVVRAVAAIRLLLGRFVETPGDDPAIVTVAIHQILSIITEQGGARAEALYKTLCGAGPLAALTPGDFVELLRWISAPEVRLIEQAPDGTLMLASMGEELTAARDFYAVFETDQEWKLIHGTSALGSIPISNVLAVGSVLAFAGRRWRVADVDDRAKVLTVATHPAGRLPKFDRQSVEPIDDRLAAEIRAVYLDDDLPAFLDETAVQLLQEGREVFRALELAEKPLIASGADTHILTWRGTAMNDVLAVCLTAAGLDCEAHDLGVTVSDATPLQVARLVMKMPGAVTAGDLSEFVANLQKAKYDMFAPPTLLRRLWARRHEGAVGQLSSVAVSVSHSANLIEAKTYSAGL